MVDWVLIVINLVFFCFCIIVEFVELCSDEICGRVDCNFRWYSVESDFLVFWFYCLRFVFFCGYLDWCNVLNFDEIVVIFCCDFSYSDGYDVLWSDCFDRFNSYLILEYWEFVLFWLWVLELFVY